MIGQYLSNKNESTTVSKSKHFSDLNKAEMTPDTSSFTCIVCSPLVIMDSWDPIHRQQRDRSSGSKSSNRLVHSTEQRLCSSASLGFV